MLIEDLPGTGKTLMAKTLGSVLGLQYTRLQFTPDLLPSDVVGFPVLDPLRQELVFRPGPVFTNLLLADEINRTPPKTQAALLEAMQERTVTIDGESLKLSDRFTVVATQNPIEQQGVYPLPEAQLDRFLFKQTVDYPSAEEERKIIAVHGARPGTMAPADWGVTAVAEWTAARAPVLDAIVHNAAVNPAPHETIDELSPDTLRAVLAVNVEAVVFLTTALLGPLRAAGAAQVLAVSSEAGMFSHGLGPTGLSYRMSKAALNAFVLVASQALPGIRVNAVHPGWVRTEMGGASAPLSPEDAARSVLAVLGESSTGRIYEAGRTADW